MSEADFIRRLSIVYYTRVRLAPNDDRLQEFREMWWDIKRVLNNQEDEK